MIVEKCVGVVLAGGNGTRLQPLTRTINKHLLPVNGEPMLHWPIQALASLGIDEIIMVLGGKSCGNVIEHFGSSYGRHGISISYVYQQQAGGIPDAFACAAPLLESMNATRAVIVLGDNIFPNGIDPDSRHQLIKPGVGNAVVLAKTDLIDVASYGCAAVPVGFSGNFGSPHLPVIKLVEKPNDEPSKYDHELSGYKWAALLGVYSVPLPYASKYCKSLRPSKRGELEIVDLLSAFAKDDALIIENQKQKWIDAGDPRGYELSNDVGFWS